jgi:CheY-like chemotaxis protein
MTMRILLADDEPDIRMVVRMRLQRQGWTVEEVSSGYEALAACREHPSDLVILDQRMGGFTGMEVADILLGESFDRPIIIFSAYLDPGLEAQAQDRGLAAIAKADLSALVDEVAAHAGTQ